jgi:hypothetical protein
MAVSRLRCSVDERDLVRVERCQQLGCIALVVGCANAVAIVHHARQMLQVFITARSLIKKDYGLM